MTRTMRLAAAGLALAAATTAMAGSALALNPQPLPPGLHVHRSSATRFEPPDPCLRAHARRAAATCAGQTRTRARHGSSAMADGSVHFRK